jgi:hypothetical protein
MKYAKWISLFFSVFISIYFILAIRLEKNIIKGEKLIKNEKKFSLESYKKKRNIRNIIALVFYGRESSVSILLKYLEKNLKSNGGILDKIIFAVKTDKIEDIKYLDKYLKNKRNSEYERFKIGVKQKYSEAYKNLHDNDLIFKIDDDVVFISNGTFERMVEEYLKNDLLILSANVVNHPILAYVHSKLGAILPFTELNNYTLAKSDNLTIIKDIISEKRKNSYMKNLQFVRIIHESFFDHFKNDNLKVYDFGLWDFHSSEYTRWSINFILFKGNYVKNVNSIAMSDEHVISIEIPKLHNKHAYALGSALVSHFSYMKQYDYLSKTDILNKYKIIQIKNQNNY